MFDWFASGGVIMWPVLGAGLLAVGLGVDAWRRVLTGGSGGRSGPGLRSRADAVLFWGGFAALLGVLGTVVGIARTAEALGRAGGAPADVVWRGFRVTLPPTTLGLVFLLVALLAWLGLRVARGREPDA